MLRLRKYNLKLNPSKSVFGASSVHYLGYNISGEGIRPGEEKMKAIEDFPVPDTPKKIREFVGLANYFRFLLPGFAEHSARPTDLFQRGQPVQVRTASGRGTDCVQSTTDGPLFEPTGGAPISRQGLHSHHGRGNRRLGTPGRDGGSPVPDAQRTRESYRLRQQGPEGQREELQRVPPRTSGSSMGNRQLHENTVADALSRTQWRPSTTTQGTNSYS